MFTTTFYSYKGGVGRTLALANVAAHLAMRGKKVLIVDFDLEAPGITTFGFSAMARNELGLVDYINSYLEKGVAPDASSYIHPCSFRIPNEETEVELFVMPAGDQSPSYGQSFTKIDWRALYEEREGFLLMEDLRAQWLKLGFDYVLIDSRTGHTDASGICTRQLPDALVTVFFPNEQNLIGLKDVLANVRNSSGRPRSPTLLFVASRLPRLDDEDGVLDAWLDRFKNELSYREAQLCKVEQYDSLALLDQDIFVVSRPKTGLARQFRALSTQLAQQNDEDPEGALQYIRAMMSAYRRGKREDLFDKSNPYGIKQARDRFDKIEEFHKNDSVIQRYLAEHYYNSRDFIKLETALRRGIRSGVLTGVENSVPEDNLPQMHLLQMRMAAETGDDEVAVSAAHGVLECQGLSIQMVLEALMFLVSSSNSVLPAPAEIPFLQVSDQEQFKDLLRRFNISSREAEYGAEIAAYARDRFSDQGLISGGRSDLFVLALIGGGKFEEALALLDASPAVDDDGEIDVAKAYNHLMARWGSEGLPDKEQAQELLALLQAEENKLQSQNTSANFQQCFALLYSILGQVEECKERIQKANERLGAAGRPREVSCWSFVEEPEEVFKEHCNLILRLANGENEAPLFISRKKKLIN